MLSIGARNHDTGLEYLFLSRWRQEWSILHRGGPGEQER